MWEGVAGEIVGVPVDSFSALKSDAGSVVGIVDGETIYEVVESEVGGAVGSGVEAGSVAGGVHNNSAVSSEVVDTAVRGVGGVVCGVLVEVLRDSFFFAVPCASGSDLGDIVHDVVLGVITVVLGNRFCWTVGSIIGRTLRTCFRR